MRKYGVFALIGIAVLLATYHPVGAWVFGMAMLFLAGWLILQLHQRLRGKPPSADAILALLKELWADAKKGKIAALAGIVLVVYFLISPALWALLFLIAVEIIYDLKSRDRRLDGRL